MVLIGDSCFAEAAPLNGEGLPVAYATGSLPPRDELPLINGQTALNLDFLQWDELPLINGQTAFKIFLGYVII